MHENGLYTVKKGKLVSDICEMKEPMIVFDKKIGIVLKYGDKKDSNIKDYYTTMINKLNEKNKDMVDDICLIDFSTYELDIDDICTLFNYLLNNPGIDNTTKLFCVSKEELLEILDDLKKYGF